MDCLITKHVCLLLEVWRMPKYHWEPWFFQTLKQVEIVPYRKKSARKSHSCNNYPGLFSLYHYLTRKNFQVCFIRDFTQCFMHSPKWHSFSYKWHRVPYKTYLELVTFCYSSRIATLPSALYWHHCNCLLTSPMWNRPTVGGSGFRLMFRLFEVIYTFRAFSAFSS